MEYARNPVLERIVLLEMSGILEFWNMRDGEVHILLKLPAHFCCGAPHTWFVNRDGRTRCWECNDADKKERRESARSMVAA